MNDLLPLDLNEILLGELQAQRRPPDGLMHASSHITGSLRHAQLDVAGAPKIEGELVAQMPLLIGTLIHEWLHAALRRLGVEYQAEVDCTPWMPRGWGGTADAVIFNQELGAWALVDWKTQKGEGMRYIERGGAKAEHIAQVSAYYWALKASGLPMLDRVAVWYIPKNETRGKDDIIMPLLVDFEPTPEAELYGEMLLRRDAVDEYLDSLPESNPRALFSEDYVTDELAPVQEREQRIFFERGSGTWTVKLMRHWSTAYCPYESVLCDCSDQSENKIGEFDIDGITYIPRNGYEDIHPTVFPDV